MSSPLYRSADQDSNLEMLVGFCRILPVEREGEVKLDT